MLFDTPLWEAVICAVVLDVTAAAVAAKLPDVLPAATVTDAGTVNWAAEEDNVTVVPPVGAALDSVTVQADVPGPDIVVGLHVRDDSVTGVAGLSDKLTLFETPLYEAVTRAVALVVMVPAVAANVADVLPAGTTMEPGTLNCEEEAFVDNATVAPPVGAAPDRPTVQVEVPEDEIVVGLHVRDDKVTGGTRVRATLLDTPPYEPVT